MKTLAVITMSFLLTASLLGQASCRPVVAPAPAIDMQLANTLSILERSRRDHRGALGKMRVDKWKTDSSTKQQYQENLQSLQRNLDVRTTRTDRKRAPGPAGRQCKFQALPQCDHAV